MRKSDIYVRGAQVVTVSVSAKDGIKVSQPEPLVTCLVNKFILRAGRVTDDYFYMPTDEPTIIHQPIGFGLKCHVYAHVDFIEQAKAYCIERLLITARHELAEAQKLVDTRSDIIKRYEVK